jgi:hypothetical protein
MRRVVAVEAGKLQGMATKYGTTRAGLLNSGQCMSTIVTLLAVFVTVALLWRFCHRRPSMSGLEFVHVNQDGSVRELSPAEKAYLSEEFSGGDSGRPYIKSTYMSRDGWGSISGFIARRRVPVRIKILPVHPDYDARAKELGFDMLGSNRAAGDIIEIRADGSVACIPNPKISRAERFELSRRWHLADQRQREMLAVVPDAKSNDKADA